MRAFPNAVYVDDGASVLEHPCDILIPAAMEGVIHKGNAERIKARLIIEAANGPVTFGADEILRNRENVQTVTDHWRVADAQVEAQLEADRSASHPGVRLPHLNKRRPTVARVRRGASPVGRRDDQR